MDQQASSNKTVLISGAGIAGPTLAYWLVRHGYKPTIVETAPALRKGGYLIDFWGVGYDVAERMGLIPKLRGESYDTTQVRSMDAQGRRVATLDATAFPTVLAGRFFSIMRTDLSHVIFRATENDVETVFGDEIIAIEQSAGAANVTFRSGAERSFGLVVGADGLHSRVRRIAFGPETRTTKFLGYYVAAFATDYYPHRDEHAYVLYTALGRQVGRYALRGNRTVFIFIFAAPDRIPGVHHDIDAARKALRSVFHGGGWEVPEILDALERTDEIYFDEVSQIRMDRWSDGRVVLIGDAAYCPSLLAGQGSGFAMAGAYLLAGELSRAHGNHAAAFAAYESRFRPFVEKKQRGAVRIGGWFAPRTRLGLIARNVITQMMSWPLVAEWIVNRMIADHFDLPDYEENEETNPHSDAA